MRALGAEFDIVAPDIDETPLTAESAVDYVARVSAAKAAAVRDACADSRPVLAADTCVVAGGRILGKPRDADLARTMLASLAARTHSTVTGVTVNGATSVDTVTVSTDVTFTEMSAEQIAWYVATGEPLDKAGGYAIQGIGGAFVRRIVGSHSNVIGLPLAETVELLARHGVALTGRCTG